MYCVVWPEDGQLLAATEQRQEARLTRAGYAEEGRSSMLYEPRDIGIWDGHWLGLEAEAAGCEGYPLGEGLTTILRQALWRDR